MLSQPKTPLYRRPAAITFIYVLLSICWIVVTDQILHHLWLQPRALMTLSIAKGALCVLATASLIFAIVSRFQNFHLVLEHQVRTRTLALEASEREYKNKATELRMALEAAEAGTFDLHLGSNQLKWSPELERLYGFQPGEFSGTIDHWSERIHDDDRARTLRCLKNDIAEGKGLAQFRIIRNSDGDVRWVEASGVTIRDEAGNAVRFIGINTDITERKRSELELRSLQEQFQHAQKMEAIGRLAGGIAHDFNNLLQVINAYSAMLEMGATSDKTRRRLNAIRDAGARATELTAQLLNFSRRKPLEPIDVCVDSVLHSMEKLIRPLIGDAIEFSISLDSHKAHVTMDPGQLEQIIMNLVVNARDAMPAGGQLAIHSELVTLTGNELSKFVYAAEPGAYVCICISDTGQGIEASIQPMIFEPFFTTKEPGKGTGLGLSTTYAIVKQSRGAIRLESQADMGTRICVYLPVTQSVVHHNSDVEISNLPLGTERILVAEDEFIVRSMVTDVLTELGYRVLTAADGQEALDLAESNADTFDAVVSDVAMPRLSGVELCRVLKQRRPEAKFILMSGSSGQDSHAMVPEMHFLRKPFSAAELAARVREVLDN